MAVTIVKLKKLTYFVGLSKEEHSFRPCIFVFFCSWIDWYEHSIHSTYCVLVLSPRTLSVTNCYRCCTTKGAHHFVSLTMYTVPLYVYFCQVHEILFAILTRKICKTQLWTYRRASLGRSELKCIKAWETLIALSRALHAIRIWVNTLPSCFLSPQINTMHSVHLQWKNIYLIVTYMELSQQFRDNNNAQAHDVYRMENSISDVLQVL